MEMNKLNHYTQSYLTPFIRLETFVKTADSGLIQFFNLKSSNYIIFNVEELKEFLSQARESMEPNIPHPFKFRNLFKKDFYIRHSFPKKLSVTNRSKTFTFDEASLRKLFEIEKSIYNYIKACQRTYPIISQKTRDEMNKLI